jgi:sensory rhodopsin
MEKPKDIKVLSETTKNTFFSAYLVLFGYTSITLIEAIRTPSVLVRNIMNIETAVSLIAGLVYGYLNDEVRKPGADLSKITHIRYLDWSITTPLILLTILLFYNGSSSVDYKTFLGIATLNAGMLYSGYLGETGAIHKMTGGIVGFLFFGAMLALLYTCCVPKTQTPIVFIIFAVLWALYGVAYYIEDVETKNICYNLLDISSKALFGVVLWSYYGKVLKY